MKIEFDEDTLVKTPEMWGGGRICTRNDDHADAINRIWRKVLDIYDILDCLQKQEVKNED